MLVDDRLAAVLPVRVVVVHVGRHRPGPVERDQRGDVVEARRRQRAHEGAHGATLQLEDPHRVAALEHGEDLGVGQVDVVDVGSLARAHLDEVEADLDHREVPQPEEVHLEQAQLLDVVHLELGDDGRVGQVPGAVGLALDGQVLGQRLVGDHHGSRVDAVAAAQALEPLGHVDDALGHVVALVHVAQVRGGDEAVLVAGGLVQARRQRRVAAHQQRRHGLGHPVAVVVRVPQHPRRVAHGSPGLDRREGDDLGHVVGAVAVGGVLDHLAAVAVVEVHVDVGHLLATRIQEALEEQVVADRVEVHDAEAVGDAAARGRPAARPHPDLRLARVADEVPDDEEVGGEAHVADDVELVVDPLAHHVVELVAVAAPGALVGQLAQVLRGACLVAGAADALGHRELGQAGLAQLELDVGPLGDEQRRVARRLDLPEEVAHLGSALEVVLVGVEAEAVDVGEQRPGLDAQQRVVRLGVGAVGVVAVVRCQQGRADLRGDLDELGVGPGLLGQAVVLELDEEVVLAEDLLEPTCPLERLGLVAGQQGLEDHAAQAARGGDQALVVGLEQLPVDPGLVVVALEVRRRGELEQVLVALRRLRDQRQVVVELVAAVGVPAGVVDLAPAHRSLVARLARHVGLGPDDRVDAGVLAGLVEVEDPVHVAVVGDPERRHAVLDRGIDEVLDPRRTIEHRVLGVGVQMRERPRQDRDPPPGDQGGTPSPRFRTTAV